MTAILIAIVFKGSILMGATAALVALMGRASAATRHAVWSLAIAGLLLLPVFSASVPSWEIAVPLARTERRAWTDSSRDATTLLANSRSRTGSEPAGARVTTRTPSAPPGREIPWAVLAAALYVLAVAFLLGRLVVQRSAARRIVNDATLVTEPAWTSALDHCRALVALQHRVTLRRSREQLMPMTTGTLTPAIVIPADSDTWDDDRRRAVLLHELAHIARRDCLTQTLTAIACALYCVHPGVWYIAHRLRIERELACDDRVLAAGAHASDYASHLLELAYQWSGRRAPALAVGMASSRKLEGRMRAVLDSRRNRTTPTRRLWLAGAVVGAAVLLPLAAMTFTTASANVRSSLMGPSGADEPRADAEDSRPQAAERPVGSPDDVTGTWELRQSSTRDSVRIEVRSGASSDSSELSSADIERLLSQSLADAKGPVRLTISRDAGSLEIEGTMNVGTGSGTFRFVPSHTFIDGLTRRGFTRPTARQLFRLARNDVGFEFIDELAAQKYERPDLDALVRASDHGVDADFVREMAQSGYRLVTLDALVRFRDHGVDPEFVRGMRAQGVSGLSPDDIVRARDHGVDPEYVAELASLGYPAVPFEVLVRTRDHGVDGEYLRAMRQLGFTFTLEEAIRTRDHGVDPEFARGMRGLGYTLAADDLIRARDHGVEPQYIQDIAREGYKGLPIETLIRLRDHGVTADYVQQIRTRGNDTASPEELIRLRDRGAAVSREQEIKEALARLVDQYWNLARQALDERAAGGNAR
jgi:beta-lactamase regulating signal transducer with metallopeptidase domain